jgi:hypothetical protein
LGRPDVDQVFDFKAVGSQKANHRPGWKVKLDRFLIEFDAIHLE